MDDRDTQGPDVEEEPVSLVGEWPSGGVDYLTGGERVLAAGGGLGGVGLPPLRGVMITGPDAQRPVTEWDDMQVLDDLDEAVGELCRDAAELARYVRVVRRRGRAGGRGRR
jgi:hypothetical protein